MSKWRLWKDEYFGSDWNDRQEISSPQLEGIEIPDKEVENTLLANFLPEVEQFVEIDGDEDYVSASLDYCLKCDTPATLCKCDDTEDNEDNYLCVSYHAERVT